MGGGHSPNIWWAGDIPQVCWNVPHLWTLPIVKPIVKQQANVMEPKHKEIMRHKQGSILMSTG
jgi:hypothetical protein